MLGDAALSDTLLDNGGDLALGNQNGDTAWSIAIALDYERLAEKLVSAGAKVDPNKRVSTTPPTESS